MPKNSRVGKCPRLVGFTRGGDAKLIPCGMWSCTGCARRLARKWARRAYLHIEAKSETGASFYFYTLTLGSAYRYDVERGFRSLPTLWGALRKDISRKKGNFEYLAFVEGQPERRGMPHFHILMDCEPPAERNKGGKITKHALHNYAVKRGFGYETDLSLVGSKLASFYVCKYASKQHEAIPSGFRRVRCSQTWTKLPIDPFRRLLVRAYLESIADYIDRVNYCSGVPHEELYNRYANAVQDLQTIKG
jgi:hypothetical protein